MYVTKRMINKTVDIWRRRARPQKRWMDCVRIEMKEKEIFTPSKVWNRRIPEQAGFRTQSCCNQTLKLVQNIKDAFETGMVTLRRCFSGTASCLHYSHSQTVLVEGGDSDQNFIQILRELLLNCRFQVSTFPGKKSLENAGKQPNS